MDHDHTAHRVPSVSPIPTTLKRKRGPSLSGDPLGGKPVLKQSKDASADAMADLDELEEADNSSDFGGSDSSGNSFVPARIRPASSANIDQHLSYSPIARRQLKCALDSAN